ncbi:MAG: hypothetical protein U0Y10_04585 [Spirosomataceae bacterium]
MRKLGGLTYFQSERLFREFQILSPEIAAYMVESDLQIYVENIQDKSFKGIDLEKIYNIIGEELLLPIRRLTYRQKSDAEKIYKAFIKSLTSRHRVSQEIGNNETIVLDPFKEEEEPLIKENEILLSLLESAALEFMLDRTIASIDVTTNAFDELEDGVKKSIKERKDKIKVLENFTFNGIMQLANRAALKLIFHKKLPQRSTSPFQRDDWDS